MMKRQLFFLLLVLSWIGSGAQDIEMSLFQGMEPRNVGPAGMSGRVTSIDVASNNKDHIYIGTASGGIWYSENGGTNWEPIFDEQDVGSIGAIAIDKDNNDILWAGTGEGNPRNSVSSGKGIYKSLDGGETWEHMGLEKTRNIHRIHVHEDDPSIVHVAAIGSPWMDHLERGVYRTKDGGKTWEKILYVNDRTGAADLVVDPTNPNKMFAAMWEHRRWPWFFESGGAGSGLYVTYNGGDDWKRIGHEKGLPKGELGRIGLAIAPGKPERVYALVESEKNALFRSDNGGKDWKKINDDDIGGRPFYYAELYVDPENENRVYNLYSRVARSEDGGKSFKVLLSYSRVHPDHHAFYIHPEDPSFIIDGNDGGLAISRDKGENWEFIDDLPLAQYYHINVDDQLPYNIYGGMQDNGSWKGPAYVWKKGGIRNCYWQELYFGDGFDVVPDENDSGFGFAMSQGGGLARYDLQTGNSELIKPVHPEGKELRFNWDAPIAQQGDRIYYGSQYIHLSKDDGSSWEIISPDLTTDDSLKQLQHKSGGLTKDVTNAENYTTLTCIEPSPHDQEVIWAGTDDGNLQLTKDGGENWTELSSRLDGCPDSAWVSQIRVSQFHEGGSYVVLNDYRRGDRTPYVYKTSDYGENWKRLTNPGEVEGPVHAVVQDPVQEDLLFLGTEFGLYFTIDGGNNWTKWTQGFPSVPVKDLAIQSREGDLVIGTFGRAAWVLDDLRPLRELCNTQGSILDSSLVAFDPAPGYLVHFSQPPGSRFPADGIFRGENRPYGARITFYVKELLKKEKQEKEKEEEQKPSEEELPEIKKANVWVLDDNRDTIRTFKTNVDTGFNRFTWKLRRKGVRYPATKKEKQKKEPAGPRVLPGTYTLILKYDDLKDSTMVNVKMDPRIDVSEEALEKKQALLLRHLENVEMATEAADRIREGRKIVSRVDDQLEFAPDSVKKKLRKKGKEVTDTLSSLYQLMVREKEIQGIYRNPDLLQAKLGKSGWYLGSAMGKPNATQKQVLEQTEKEVEKTVDKINEYFSTEWKNYQNLVESATYPVFPDYEEINREGN